MLFFFLFPDLKTFISIYRIYLNENANPHTKSSVVKISMALRRDLLSSGLSNKALNNFLRYSMMIAGKLLYSLLSLVDTWWG